MIISIILNPLTFEFFLPDSMKVVLCSHKLIVRGTDALICIWRFMRFSIRLAESYFSNIQALVPPQFITLTLIK